MFFMIERCNRTKMAAAMGNWWLAASSGQHACSCIMSRAVFDKISNHSGDLAPLQPRCGTLRLLAFPKLKSPLKGKRFHTIDENQENMTRQLMVIPTKDFAECSEQWKRCWENCVRSQGAYFGGDWGTIVLCTMFLVSCIFFNKCLCFS